MRFTPTLVLFWCATLLAGRPNIVLIMCDDMGWADLGCYGSKQNPTPNIDQLGKEGVRFTNFLATQAVCTSSRVALLTGCYPNRLGLGGTALGPNSKIGLSNDEQTLGTLLQKAGYHTGVVGKWHLGDAPKFLPPSHGFDESMITPYSNDMWPRGYGRTDESRRKMYPELPRLVNGHLMGYTRDWVDMDALTSSQGLRAVRFIKDNAGKAQPFFLYLATSMPHTPLGASSEFKGKHATPYADTLADLDHAVGAVLRTLREKKVEQETIVIFTSDNGPWLNFGRHAGSAGPFREGKGTTFEGGVRVPFIVRWPGVVKAGSETDALAANIDVVPTLLAATEAPAPKNEIDGVSFLSVLKSGQPASRDSFAYYYGDRLEAVRKGKWKLHLPHAYRSYVDMIPAELDGYPAKTHQLQIGFSLYDLEKDPGEKEDLAAAQPEVVKELQALADSERKRLDAGKRPVGRL
ncbi:MAG: sulfatase [Opitutales bacterium]